ncbi:hypothetical protein Clacol_006141 [Clathrus columnatus]|uniref:Phosphatidic acid phosphatase type 2/haloperoxidase domain-containing protein n=1 Tax=Clathrus columnatus TaxID=1419009 RepID=A0AAV5AFJ7_9AGAM|nr:hypothetical protein Clacol_006141 [Clathrus columnatus]
MSVRSFWDFHAAWLGCRPRPDFIDRCQPKPGSVDHPVFGLSNASICTQSDKGIFFDGFKSFPSGHSSTLIAVSRTVDNRHHWHDVMVGSSLGLSIAWLCYRQLFYPLVSSNCHEALPPRNNVKLRPKFDDNQRQESTESIQLRRPENRVSDGNGIV